jgi:hypothetical protein
MVQDPLQVLHAVARAASSVAAPRLLIAGATGALGNEVLRRLAGSSSYAMTQVLAREPVTQGMRKVQTLLVPPRDPGDHWPGAQADIAVVMFDPPRLFNDRERALWTPSPGQLPELARWRPGAEAPRTLDAGRVQVHGALHRAAGAGGRGGGIPRIGVAASPAGHPCRRPRMGVAGCTRQTR